jgi:hypothetical protein
MRVYRIPSRDFLLVCGQYLLCDVNSDVGPTSTPHECGCSLVRVTHTWNGKRQRVKTVCWKDLSYLIILLQRVRFWTDSKVYTARHWTRSWTSSTIRPIDLAPLASIVTASISFTIFQVATFQIVAHNISVYISYLNLSPFDLHFEPIKTLFVPLLCYHHAPYVIFWVYMHLCKREHSLQTFVFSTSRCSVLSKAQ